MINTSDHLQLIFMGLWECVLMLCSRRLCVHSKLYLFASQAIDEPLMVCGRSCAGWHTLQKTHAWSFPRDWKKAVWLEWRKQEVRTSKVRRLAGLTGAKPHSTPMSYWVMHAKGYYPAFKRNVVLTHVHMDKPKWNKLNTKGHTLHNSIYVRFPE